MIAANLREGPPAAYDRDVPASVRPTPTLRIEEMAVQGFRTFKERAVVPFRAGRKPAEPIATIHGDSATGKSNLLAALGAFFRGADACLSTATGTFDVPLEGRGAPGGPIHWRDRFRVDTPTVIDVRFADARLVPLRLSAVPNGSDLRLSLTYLAPNDIPAPGHLWPDDKLRPLNEELRAWLAPWIRAPLGPETRPIAFLRARDVGSCFWHGVPDPYYPLSPFGEELYRYRTALDPASRDLWHRFVLAVRGLVQFENKDISVERLDGPAELVIEDRGRTVLRFAELSASEQQALALAAFSFLSRSALIAIEYPETHLDAPMKTALLTLLQRRIDAARIDQVFLETHETQFDGPTVLRVYRKEGRSSDVVRAPSVGEAPAEMERKGREDGAKQGWVTRDGYTQLPEPMREDLELTLGGHVWFLKGKSRWEAWAGHDLERLFPREESEERDSQERDA